MSTSVAEGNTLFPISRFVIRLSLCLLIILGMAIAVHFAERFLFGRPDSYGFSICPTAFFACSLLFISTGGLLGFTTLSESLPQLEKRMIAGLLMGATALGTQTYGIWCLLPERFNPEYPRVGLSLILVGLHLLGCILVLLVASAAVVLITGGADRPVTRQLLRVCGLYWFGMGLCWTALLCGFSILLG
ncbi:hypothetical protein [Planctomicrobium sp. SH664]|uniref:hypothetical protein n=1 Tax=Planctomicrobium sp. SH664 TaxID=3448125 RepID=UPI003F5C0666